MFQFEWLWAFLFLPLPWLVRYFMPPARNNKTALKVPFLSHFQRASERSHKTWLTLLVAALAWCLLVTATARPQWVQEHTRVPQSGRDLMLALDISDSMNTRDFVLGGQHVNRLEAAKSVAVDFIEARKGDRIGIVIYASQPALQMPLSFDIDTARDFIKATFIGIVDKQRTAIGDAIGFTLKHLLSNKEDEEDAQKVLILLTDGQNNAGVLDPKDAAELAANNNMKIYSIGIGSRRHRQGLDENMLKMLAKRTEGRYFYASDTRALQKVYAIIDELEAIEHEEQTFITVSALFVWPLALAALLAFVLVVMTRAR